MSTSRHIDIICIAAIVIALVSATVYSCIAGLGLINSDNTVGYENRIFNTDKVHTIDIVMDDWDSFIENCESEEYSACTVVIDGEKFGNIGIRAKGNTSLSSVKSMGSERYSLKLEFDQYEDGKSYYGLDKLCLNNLIQDNTMMKDYLVYRMMDEFGVDAPLCSYAYITVNGEDWGLYLAVEAVEDSFLERNYGGETGELYKPDSISFGGGRGNGKGFDMEEFQKEQENSDNSDGADSAEGADAANGFPEDFSGDLPEGFPGDFSGEFPSDFPGGFGGGFPGVDSGAESSDADSDSGTSDKSGFPGNPFGGDKGGFGGFGGMGSSDVKLQYIDDDPDSYSNIFESAKTEISKKDKERLISSLKSLSEYTDLEEVLDTEEVLRYFVIHNFVNNGDSYTGSMIHNYYLYEEDGKMSMIPWDYNLAFGTFMGSSASDAVNASIDNPVSGGNVDDRPMVGWIFSDEEYTDSYHELMEEFLEEWFESGKLSQMISDTADLIRPYVEKDPTKFCTTEEFESGVEAISQFVELRAEAVSKQLSGDDTLVDTADLDLNDMGTMNNGGEGGGGGPQGGPQGMFGGGTAPDMSSGDRPTGDKPTGDKPTGDMPSGDRPTGDMPSGDGPTGDMPDKTTDAPNEEQ